MATSNARLQRSDLLDSESSFVIITLPDSDTASRCDEMQQNERFEKDNSVHNDVFQCGRVFVNQKNKVRSFAASKNAKEPARTSVAMPNSFLFAKSKTSNQTFECLCDR